MQKLHDFMLPLGACKAYPQAAARSGALDHGARRIKKSGHRNGDKGQ